MALQWIRTTTVLAVLAAVLAAVFLRVPELEPAPPVKQQQCDATPFTSAARHLSQLIQIPTISNSTAQHHVTDPAAFEQALTFLEDSYPAVFRNMKVEKMGSGNFSLLLTWTGTEPGLLPVLLISHYDVVPVTPASLPDWVHPPFSGHVDESGHIWGRGSLDIKFSVIAILEAASQLIASGYQPARTIMITIGHDEEVMGDLGAGEVAAELARQGIQLEVVIDEGGLILEDGLRPFTHHPTAIVGTAEKGYISVVAELSSPGSHSSMPPIDGTDIAAQLSKYLAYIQAHLPPPHLPQPVVDMMQSIRPYTSKLLRQYLLPHIATWPLSWIVPYVYTKLSRETAAMVRTTVALTRLEAGVADNVLPQQARLLFNTRPLPGDTPETVVQYFQHAAKAAQLPYPVKVQVQQRDAIPPSNVSSSQGVHFALLRQAIQEYWRAEDGQAVAVVPYLCTGGTDSKHYGPLSKHGILRFVPMRVNKGAGDLQRIHGTNERARVQDLHQAICTYRRIMQLFSQRDYGAHQV